jgi:hypothetical protein
MAIFFSIVRLLVPYGMFFSLALGCLRFCLEELLTCMLVGELPTILGGVLLCGRWYLCAFCVFMEGNE